MMQQPNPASTALFSQLYIRRWTTIPLHTDTRRVSRLQLESLTKRFVGLNGIPIDAVRAASLDIGHQERVAVVGPSGSGKTTLLRMIAGLERPTDGVIRMGEQDVTARAAAARNVGMLFQNLALYPHMTAGENIGLCLRLRKRPAQEIQRRVRVLAERLHVHEQLQRRPFELSGGQRQRVALARALIREPDFLLLDEPLSDLDAPLRRELCRELNALHTEFGLTTLLVTHDLRIAEALCQRVAVMRDGQMIQVGTLSELRAQPANTFVSEFLAPDLL